MNDGLALTTFYQQFRSGEGEPEDNSWVRVRVTSVHLRNCWQGGTQALRISAGESWN
jgi:hypothetical protein